MERKKYLVLENDLIFEGEAIGSKDKEVKAEVVFNTSMTGYQEVLTDPSYCGQIITFTYPLIGNYGFNASHMESIKPHLEGVIVRDDTKHPNHWSSNHNLDEFLKMYNIPGISKIDTRKLAKVIREAGTLKGCIVNNPDKLNFPSGTRNENLVDKVSSKRIINHHQYLKALKIVVIDFGIKSNIIKELQKRKVNIITVPYNTPMETIEKLQPHGIVLSNGPGDPQSLSTSIKTIERLIKSNYPLFGICLGHQLIALSLGGCTKKMRFGHRGTNHPVKDVIRNKVFITSQNHGYTVDAESLTNTGLEVMNISLNDNTVEGIYHNNKPVFSVQFHPESNPGTNDTKFYFDEYIKKVENFWREKQCQNV